LGELNVNINPKHQADYEYWKKITKAIQPFDPQGYIEVIHHEDYQELSDADILDKLRYRHLLVTRIPHRKYGFDRGGLHMIGSFTKPITIHGS
jgi:hypothetical protein